MKKVADLCQSYVTGTCSNQGKCGFMHDILFDFQITTCSFVYSGVPLLRIVSLTSAFTLLFWLYVQD